MAGNTDPAETPSSACHFCGKPLPAGAETCPHCHRPQAGPGLRPLGGPAPPRTPGPPAAPPAPEQGLPPAAEPLPPAPGQESFSSFAYLKSVMRGDPLFFALLVLLGLNVLLPLLAGWILLAVLPLIVFWGIYTFRWWGYLIAMIGVGFGLFWLLVAVVASAGPGRGIDLASLLLSLGFYLFVFVVLYRRRDYFD